MNICKLQHHSSNLTPQETKALVSRQNLKDLVVSQADKGGSIVVQNREDYIHEIKRLPGDSNSYSLLSEDALPSLKLELHTLIDLTSSEGILSTKEKAFLYSEYYNTPYVY